MDILFLSKNEKNKNESQKCVFLIFGYLYKNVQNRLYYILLYII